MKDRFKYCLWVIMLLICVPIFGQTTYFNDSPAISNNVSCKLYSIEIRENATIVTVELSPIKATRELTASYSYSSRIESENYTLASISGFYYDGKIHSSNSVYWSNVPAGEKRRAVLYYNAPIPSGLTKISIKGCCGYDFNNYTITNPRKNYTSFNSEYAIKQHVDANNDGYCGIYEQVGGGSNYKLACVKYNGEYTLVYMSSSNNFDWWKFGDIKAYLHKSPSGIFKADWFMTNKSVNKDSYIVFDGLSMSMTQPSGIDPGEQKYLKMYPANSPSVDGGSGNSGGGGEWTGTGFALKNGYIVTNNHVVDGAKSIVVLGVNGNTSTEYKARVIGVDKNNDLALIKIDDYRFNGFTSVPYAVKNTVCEVGADVFVLGYPLTTYMGEEVKLTNGIVSSRTGYQGDITTYQISAPVQPGNSGGPMFDSQGNVVGIVNAGIPGAENVGYAIKTSYLFNLVSTYASSAIIPQTNTVTGTSLADKVKQVKKCVFFIKCKGN